MENLRKAENWTGVWTALVTPLNSKGEVDEISLERLIELQIQGGIRGLVIAGSTGEGSLLAPNVYESLLHGVSALSRGRIPLVAGLGIGGTASCLRNIEIARKYQYAGVLAPPPAYVKAPARGLKEHFLKLAQGALPVCIYEIPGRAASSIPLELLSELAADSRLLAQNLVAIKDASADLERALDEKRLLKERFALLSGDDPTFAPFLASGGTGIISIVSHLLPKSMNFILKSMQQGKVSEALAEQTRIQPLAQAMCWESNPIPIKSILAAQGILRELHFCEPLCPMRKDLLDRALELCEKIKDRA